MLRGLLVLHVSVFVGLARVWAISTALLIALGKPAGDHSNALVLFRIIVSKWEERTILHRRVL